MTGYATVLPLLLVAFSMAPSEGAPKSSVKLPSFIIKCSIKDPNLNQCALDAGRIVMPKVIRGYPPMRLPSLDPFTIEEITVVSGQGRSAFTMGSRNIIVTGLADVFLRNITIDLKNKIYTTTCDIPRIQILADYSVNGQVLLLPIRGNGKANFTFVNATMLYKQPYKLVKRGDQLFHELPPPTAEFNSSRAYFHLDNLFNGDKTLGETVNKFLDENWREIMDELSGPFLEATVQVIHQFSTAMGGNVPYNEIFLDVD